MAPRGLLVPVTSRKSRHRSFWPTISIVIPSYNYGRFLERALLSVLSQDYPHCQLIVIDGGSTDNTSAVLARYADQLDVCLIEPDEGQTDALNKGFRFARGDLFSWLNADDAYRPGAFLEVAHLWRKGYDMIGGACCNIYELDQREELVYSRTTSFYRYLDFFTIGFRGFLPQPAVFVTATLAEKTFPLQVGLRRAMDQQYFLRILRQRPRQVCTQSVLVDFYYHGANVTSSELPLLSELESVTRQEIETLIWPLRPLQHARFTAILSFFHWLYDSPNSLSSQLTLIINQPLLALHPIYWCILAKRLYRIAFS